MCHECMSTMSACACRCAPVCICAKSYACVCVHLLCHLCSSTLPYLLCTYASHHCLFIGHNCCTAPHTARFWSAPQCPAFAREQSGGKPQRSLFTMASFSFRSRRRKQGMARRYEQIYNFVATLFTTMGIYMHVFYSITLTISCTLSLP